jgi:hypothetical protein
MTSPDGVGGAKKESRALMKISAQPMPWPAVAEHIRNREIPAAEVTGYLTDQASEAIRRPAPLKDFIVGVGVNIATGLLSNNSKDVKELLEARDIFEVQDALQDATFRLSGVHPAAKLSGQTYTVYPFVAKKSLFQQPSSPGSRLVHLAADKVLSSLAHKAASEIGNLLFSAHPSFIPVFDVVAGA